MIRYNTNNQMTIEEFKTPFQVKLDKRNRWIRLGESLPWDALASIYYRTMSSDMGAPAIDARVVMGAMTYAFYWKKRSKYDASYTNKNQRQVYLNHPTKSPHNRGPGEW